MIKFLYLPVFTLLFLLSACKDGGQDASTEQSDAQVDTTISSENSLEGTWELVEAQLAHAGEGESAIVGEESDIAYLKIFTKKRFLAFRYNKDDKRFLGASGGTYIQLGDEFREYIEFNTWDPSLIETPQTFTCTFEDDRFIQEGYIKGGEIPDVPLREVYRRLEEGNSASIDKHPLVGVWSLEKWANGDVETPEPLPVGHKSVKLITPTHFTVFRWDESAGDLLKTEDGFDEFIYGSVDLSMDYYTEHIISFPSQVGIGKTYTFNWSIDNDIFKMTGFIDSDEFMDFKIEEYFSREE
ncbi:MAG: hypothetical protein OEQ53_00565 [Saprospiraceae bacterium]|nr:hypothetical protein [Saprospiraceae bacterium]